MAEWKNFRQYNLFLVKMNITMLFSLYFILGVYSDSVLQAGLFSSLSLTQRNKLVYDTAK